MGMTPVLPIDQRGGGVLPSNVCPTGRKESLFSFGVVSCTGGFALFLQSFLGLSGTSGVPPDTKCSLMPSPNSLGESDEFYNTKAGLINSSATDTSWIPSKKWVPPIGKLLL